MDFIKECSTAAKTIINLDGKDKAQSGLFLCCEAERISGIHKTSYADAKQTIATMLRLAA